MSGVDDLVAWLRERYDERERQLAEDERVAREAIEEWGQDGSYPWATYKISAKLEDAGWYPPPTGFDGWWQRMSPARVLAEVERGRRDIAGKRALLELHAPVDGYDPNGPVCSTCGETGNPGDEVAVVRWPCTTVRLLAQEFEGEPGWREEWRA